MRSLRQEQTIKSEGDGGNTGVGKRFPGQSVHEPEAEARNDKLMDALGAINLAQDKGTWHFAGNGTGGVVVSLSHTLLK